MRDRSGSTPTNALPTETQESTGLPTTRGPHLATTHLHRTLKGDQTLILPEEKELLLTCTSLMDFHPGDPQNVSEELFLNFHQTLYEAEIPILTEEWIEKDLEWMEWAIIGEVQNQGILNEEEEIFNIMETEGTEGIRGACKNILTDPDPLQ